MNLRGTHTSDIEQSTKSVDSMIDNPTYCVPFPVDYHSIKIYRNPLPPIFSMNSQIKGATNSINMVENECYTLPSLNERDEIEQNLADETHDEPLDYETPK